MKKCQRSNLVGYICLMASVFTFGLMVLGCESGLNEQLVENRPLANSDLVRTYKNIVGLQVSYVQKTIDIVQQYVELPEQNTRSIGSVGFDFSDIGNYLPTDLSTLKRTQLSRNAVPIEVTLEDEVNTLLAQFEIELYEALPDPSLALTLPFVEEVEEGLLIGGDTLIPYNSLSGALTIELLNAYAAGLDVMEIAQELEDALPSFFSSLGVFVEDNDSARGFYKRGVGLWPNGVVNYRWGNILPSHRDAVISAMSTWRTASNNRISWRELPNGWWENTQLTLNVIGNITISNNPNLGNYVNGKGTLGYGGGNNNILQINSKNVLDSAVLRGVSLHELGHNLGLWHEHQRYDRDDWITVTVPPGGDPRAYEKIPRDIEGWRVQYMRVRVGLWTISIPYLAFWRETNSYAIGMFDFQSIMLYAGLGIRRTNSTISSTVTRTPNNTTLSQIDISTIRTLY